MELGLMHIYCGDGVGKTTASLGLALRAAGCDKKVIFAQFMKGSPTGEIAILNKIDNITVIRNNIDFGFSPSFSEETKNKITVMHNETLEKVVNLTKLQKTDLVILDEFNSAYELDLIDKEKSDNFILHKPDFLEIVLTGRNPNEKFVEAADYISDIKCIKHPYEKGIIARKGIEY